MRIVRRMGHTCGDLLVGMELHKERHGVVDHVCALCELVLGILDLLLLKEVVLCEVGEQREHKVPVAVGDDRLGEIVLCHRARVERESGRWSWTGSRTMSTSVTQNYVTRGHKP